MLLLLLLSASQAHKSSTSDSSCSRSSWLAFLDQSKLLLLVYLTNTLLIRTFSILSPCKTVPAEQNSPQATMDAPIPALPDLCSFLNAFPAA
ncbi:hypothetical protein AB3S75_047205 [Citrus x aurantiifolia]